MEKSYDKDIFEKTADYLLVFILIFIPLISLWSYIREIWGFLVSI